MAIVNAEPAVSGALFSPRLVSPATPARGEVWLVSPLPLPDNLPIYTTVTLARFLGVDRDTIAYHASDYFSQRTRGRRRAYAFFSFSEVASFVYYLAWHSRKLSHLRVFFGSFKLP